MLPSPRSTWVHYCWLQAVCARGFIEKAEASGRLSLMEMPRLEAGIQLSFLCCISCLIPLHLYPPPLALPSCSLTILLSLTPSLSSLPLPTSLSQNATERMPDKMWVHTIDDATIELGREIAQMIPFLRREVARGCRGSSPEAAVQLPKQVTASSLRLVVEFCEYHRVLGRSDKVGQGEGMPL